MTIEDQIAALLAQADPLRGLDDDDGAKIPLAGIVDEINRLRAMQAKGSGSFEHEPDELPDRRPGRPRKTELS